MTHVGDGSAPRRERGGMLFGRGSDRIWVGEYERGWRISLAGSWIDGYFASEETARRALGLSAAELKKLFPIWMVDGENRPVTWDDLDRLESLRTSHPRRGFLSAVAVPVTVSSGIAVLLCLPDSSPDLVVMGVGLATFAAASCLVGSCAHELGLLAARKMSVHKPFDDSNLRLWATPRQFAELRRVAGISRAGAAWLIALSAAISVAFIAIAVLVF